MIPPISLRPTLRLLLAASAVLPPLGCRQSTVPEVVVYVAVDRGSSEPVLEAFENQTGVRVRALYDAEAAKTTGLVSRLLAESDRPRCDLFWNNEIAQSLLLSDRGLLAAYRSPGATGISEQWKDPAGRWTGVALRARVIVYNTKYVRPDEVPRGIFDLTNPRWRGRVAVANPQFGTTRTHVAALFAALGADRTQEYLTSLVANDVRIVDGNAMVKNLVARAHPGASPILVGLTDTDDVLAGQAEGDPIDMVFPDQESFGTLIVPSTVCLIKDAPHPDVAQQLADYLLGEMAQRQLAAGRSGYLPARPDCLPEGTDAGFALPRGLDVPYEELLKQLEPSSRWTRENFHP